ncbi:MAG: BREX-6 system phosphatase PglZ [Polyangiales bacterium]
MSAKLEAEVRHKVQRHGVVVWLDADDQYADFVNALVTARASGELNYDVRAFRGSYLRLLLGLEGVASGADRAQVLLHLPGFNDESVKQTPLYELHAAGTRFQKALKTLVTESAAGRVHPDQIAAFVEQPGLSLAGADAWLSAQLSRVAGGLGTQLDAMEPSAVLDGLLSSTDFWVAGIADAEEQAVILERLAAWTGLPSDWCATMVPAATVTAPDVAFAVASWALCVEYVDDLRRPPVSPLLRDAVALPRPVKDTCRALAQHLRGRHITFYRRTADETEALLGEEVRDAKAEDLGKVDTFRFEEDKVLKAALAALEAGAWAPALEWSGPRVDAKPGFVSFWLQEDPSRRSAWQLVRAAATLGASIAAAGPRLSTKPEVAGGSLGSLEAAVDIYVQRGAAVDEAHRQLEQQRVTLLYPQVPEFETLRARLDQLRGAWLAWADAWAVDFNALCKSQGFLPGSALQQRTLFEDVVRPMTQETGPTVYFVVDALRFEMGVELFRELQRGPDTTGTTMLLKARLCELPSVTEVGMNVLAPVAQNGRLQPKLDDTPKVLGFQAGEFRVTNPETRRRAMNDRVGGDTCPWLTLAEVQSRDSASLKLAVARAKLVVVHSQEIDAAGEKGIGPTVFDTALRQLRAAWRLLRDAGVRRFVFTSDHGFLMLDDGARAPLRHGRKIDPQRRHVFSNVAADDTGKVRVALADLGYDGVSEHVIFPETTAPFDRGNRSTTFVHGGNSLQERVIPVLTVVHRVAPGGTTLEYRVQATQLDDVAGMFCIEVRVVVAAQDVLDFGGPKELDLALRSLEGEDVQVELCQTRGKARIAGGAVQASVGERFELFFRLTGPDPARVRLELHHPGAVADVEPYVLPERFSVVGTRPPSKRPPPPETPSGETRLAASDSATAVPKLQLGTGWLDDFEGGIRQVFEHLAAHGTVTEQEATLMLGGARPFRRFAREFDVLAKKAPFGVHITEVAGVKRYVREGTR